MHDFVKFRPGDLGPVASRLPKDIPTDPGTDIAERIPRATLNEQSLSIIIRSILGSIPLHQGGIADAETACRLKRSA